MRLLDFVGEWIECSSGRLERVHGQFAPISLRFTPELLPISRETVAGETLLIHLDLLSVEACSWPRVTARLDLPTQSAMASKPVTADQIDNFVNTTF
jgi:hypothetical protein